ncbi:MAG: LD-carboxypeptidase, partial [Desulfarculaceae bacterium]|nr:LD-carboxypeptidase [Desulfarculaceae bacterium]
MIAASYPRWPRPGAPLAVAAPAGRVDPDRLSAGLAVLAELAPEREIIAGPQVLATDDYLAGPDEDRAGHLHRLLADEALGAVMAARGGFGCSRLLPRLDLAALAKARPCLLGFSDLTCLLNALAMRGLVALHGPVVTQLPRLDQASRGDLAALFRGEPPWPGELEGQGLNPGSAAGPLLGGNLTMLCHLLGTPWFPDLTGAVLIIEDTGEAPYRLDRLLTQLELAGALERVAGVAVGRLNGEEADPPEALRAVRRRLEPL